MSVFGCEAGSSLHHFRSTFVSTPAPAIDREGGTWPEFVVVSLEGSLSSGDSNSGFYITVVVVRGVLGLVVREGEWFGVTWVEVSDGGV